jgi:hypothetical protein
VVDNASVNNIVVATDEIAGVHYQKVKIVVGEADNTAYVNDANPFPVEVVSGGGSAVTEYAEGATDASITGPAIMWEDTSDTLRPVSAAKPLPVGDAGGSLTVDGTVTVNALPAGTNNIGDVDVLSVVPGTAATNAGKAVDSAAGATDTGVAVLAVRDDTLGALTPVDGDYTHLRVNNQGALHVTGISGGGGDATAANQTTIIGHLDGVEGLLTTIDVDTGGILTSVQTLDNAIAGSEMQVDVVAALPAGTNNIGDVDILSVVPGTGATNAGKAVDSVAGATDTGTAVLAVRDDALTTLTPADGDYAPLRVSSTGALHVTGGGGGTEYNEGDVDATITGSALLWEDTSDTLRPVSAAKPLPVSDTTTLVDDAAFTPGTSRVAMMGATFDNVTPDSVDEGDGGAVRMSANRNLHATLRDAAGNERGLNIDASGAALVAQSGNWTMGTVTPGTGQTALGKASDNAATTTDVGIAALAVRQDTPGTITPADGDYAALRLDSQGALRVNAGTGPAQYTEDNAHANNDAGDFVLAVRKDVPAATATADGDYTALTSDADGRQWVNNSGASNAQRISKAFNATTTQTGTDVWSPASGKKIAVESVVIGTYGTTAARVILWFGDNADTTYTAGTDQVLLAASFAPSSTAKPGLVFTPMQPVVCNTANRELHITTDAGISLDVTVHGYEF